MNSDKLRKQRMRDGVELAYREAGTGRKPVFLVHGWACDHTFLSPQLEHLSQTHHVIAVDLRGHGESSAARGEYKLSEFADDLHDLKAALQLPPAVFIGHSMGGQVAMELTARHPEDVSAICLIDSVVFPPQPLRAQLDDAFAALLADYQPAMIKVAESLFAETDDPARKAVLTKAMAGTPEHVVISSFRDHLLDYDAGPAASACKVPVAYLAATRMMADLETFRSYCPQLITAQTLGSGHFSPVEVPGQINSMLDRYLQIAAKTADSQQAA